MNTRPLARAGAPGIARSRAGAARRFAPESPSVKESPRRLAPGGPAGNIQPMRIERALTLALLLAWAAAPGVARADQCFVATSGIAFGVYDVLAPAALTGAGTVTVTCNQDRNTVQLTLSSGSSGSAGNRVMRSAGGDSLAYNLFADAGRTTVWTDATTRTFTPGKQVPYTVPIYGAVFARQDVGAGSYADSLTVVVTF